MTLFLNILRKNSWLTFLILLSITFILSCSITILSSGQKKLSKTVTAVIMGDSRNAISQHFFKTADLYFHKGAEHISKNSFDNDIFQRTKKIVSPIGHMHIKHNNIKEIMPWLWLSIKMNPHNIETYLVTSFWLANAAGKPNMALQVLEEAQLNNPYNFQVQIDKGRIYLKQGNLNEAKHAFSAALAFWDKTADQTNESDNLDRAEALLYRGLLAENEGDNKLAIKLYNEILKHFPNRNGIKNRIATIEKGEKPEIVANSLWGDILKKSIQEKSKCHREDEHEHEHTDDEHLHNESNL